MMVLLAVAALVFFAWTVYGATRVSAEVYRESTSTTLRFDDRDMLELVAEKRAALTAIKTIELDFDTGKVSKEDFEDLNAGATAEAIEVMRRLDATRSSFRYQARIDQDLDELSREISTPSERGFHRTSDDGLSWLADDQSFTTDDLSPAARARQQIHRDETPSDLVRACKSCGNPLTEDDKFCAECGQSIEQSCVACGVALHSGAKFCHECGERTTPSREVS